VIGNYFYVLRCECLVLTIKQTRALDHLNSLPSSTNSTPARRVDMPCTQPQGLQKNHIAVCPLQSSGKTVNMIEVRSGTTIERSRKGTRRGRRKRRHQSNNRHRSGANCMSLVFVFVSGLRGFGRMLFSNTFRPSARYMRLAIKYRPYATIFCIIVSSH
jgi:hypothetical protein